MSPVCSTAGSVLGYPTGVTSMSCDLYAHQGLAFDFASFSFVIQTGLQMHICTKSFFSSP